MDDNTKIAVLEQQVNSFDQYFIKIDKTLDKLTELSSAMEKIIVVHDQRLIAGEEASRELSRDHDRIHDRIDRLKTDMNSKLEKIDSRIANFEKWRWIVVGAISLIVFIISNSSSIMSFFMS